MNDCGLKRWKKVGGMTLVANRFGLEIYVQTFVNPKTGEPKKFSIFKKKEGVSIVPITPDKNLVLVRQFKQGVNGFPWEFPAGVFEGESRLETASRELMEETGYKAKEILLLPYPSHLMPRKSPCAEYVAIAQDCVLSGDQMLDEDESEIKVCEMSQKKFWEMIKNGIITSAPTKLAGLMAHLNGFFQQ